MLTGTNFQLRNYSEVKTIHLKDRTRVTSELNGYLLAPVVSARDSFLSLCDELVISKHDITIRMCMQFNSSIASEILFLHTLTWLYEIIQVVVDCVDAIPDPPVAGTGATTDSLSPLTPGVTWSSFHFVCIESLPSLLHECICSWYMKFSPWSPMRR